MPRFGIRTDNTTVYGPLLAIGLTIVGIVLAAWSVAVVAVIFVPTVLVAAVAARTVQWLEPRKNGQPDGPRIIEADYTIVDMETEK